MDAAITDLKLRLLLGAITPAIKIHLGHDLWVCIYQQIFSTKVTLGWGLYAWENSW